MEIPESRGIPPEQKYCDQLGVMEGLVTDSGEGLGIGGERWADMGGLTVHSNYPAGRERRCQGSGVFSRTR